MAEKGPRPRVGSVVFQNSQEAETVMFPHRLREESPGPRTDDTIRAGVLLPGLEVADSVLQWLIVELLITIDGAEPGLKLGTPEDAQSTANVLDEGTSGTSHQGPLRSFWIQEVGIKPDDRKPRHRLFSSSAT